MVKVKGAKRATALPSDFRPSDKHVDLARSLGVDLKREWPKFTDYALANGRTYKDWSAALNNWIRKAAEYGGRAAPLAVVTDPADLPPVEQSWMRRRK